MCPRYSLASIRSLAHVGSKKAWDAFSGNVELYLEPVLPESEDEVKSEDVEELVVQQMPSKKVKVGVTAFMLHMHVNQV